MMINMKDVDILQKQTKHQIIIFLKGTVPRDFLPLVFFFKLFLLGPGDMPRNDFDFFQLFAGIFDNFGASPVSTTPVSDTFTVLESFTGVNKPAKNYSPVSLTPAKHVTGVVDTGDVMHHY
jgi:hypothetical protein